MPSISLKTFLGNVTVGDKKDLQDTNCIRQVNMVCQPNQLATRSGYKKLDSTEYTARINLIYTLKRPIGANKTLVCSGGNLYYV